MGAPKPRYQPPLCSHQLISADPGKRACGVALWRISEGNGTLHRTLLVKQKDGDPFKLARKIISKTVEKNLPNVFFVEDPQFYPKDRAPHADLKSLTALARPATV